MKQQHPNFLVGFIIGTLLILLFWYWNKATTSENGALDLLSRFAGSQARVKELEGELAALRPRGALSE